MGRIGWWVRKEVREWRGTLVILLLGMLAVTWFMVWKGRGPAQVWESDGSVEGGVVRIVDRHLWDRARDWSKLWVVAVWTVTITMAALAFLPERQRGVLPLVGRTPDAWQSAFLGKITFVALVGCVAALLQGIWLGRLAAIYNLQERNVPVDVLWLGPAGPLPLTLTVGGLWAATVFLLGSVVGPARVPAVGGGAAAACLALPFALLDDGTDWFYDWWLGSLRPLFVLGAIAALGIACVAWFRWLRTARNAWSAPLLSGLAMLVVGGGTLAVAAVKRAEYDDVHPVDADVHLTVAAIGHDARYAFVAVARARETPAWLYGAPYSPRGRLYAIDLHTGTSRSLGSGWFNLPQASHGYPGVLDATQVELWQRGGSLVEGSVLSATTLEPTEERAAERAMLAAVRDRFSLPDGRGGRVWLSRQGLHEEGADGVTRTTQPDLLRPLKDAGALRPIPGGWLLRWGGQSWEGHAPLAQTGPWASIEAADGRVRYLGIEAVHPRGYEVVGWISPARVLLTPRLGASDPRHWRALSLDTRSSEPALREALPTTPVAMRPLAVLGSTSVLCADMTNSSEVLTILELKDGSTRLLPIAWGGMERVRTAWALEDHALPSAVGGVVVVGVVLANAVDRGREEAETHGAVGSRRPSASPQRVDHRWVIVRAADGTAWSVGGEQPPFTWLTVLGVAGDGAVWALEDARRIVRYGPGTGVREVLFPRAP